MSKRAGGWLSVHSVTCRVLCGVQDAADQNTVVCAPVIDDVRACGEFEADGITELGGKTDAGKLGEQLEAGMEIAG